MKRMILTTLMGLSLLCLASAGEKKSQPKTALPPHKLDGAFDNANTVKEVNEALLNNDLFKKAVKAAVDAKKAQIQWYKDHPGGASSSPEQAARQAFLETLRDEPKDEK